MDISKNKEEVSLPPDDLVQDLIRGLDKSFEKLPLKPAFSIPRFRKRESGTHGLEHLDQAPCVDEDTRLLTGSHTNNPPITFTCQEFSRIDGAMRKMLYPLSAMSAAARAISEVVQDREEKEFQELYSVIAWQRRQIATLAEHHQFLLGSMALARRQAIVKTMKCDPTFSATLNRQPWSSEVLFNNKIKEVAKEVKDFEGSTTTVQLSSKSVADIAKSLKAFSKTRNYQPTTSCFQKKNNSPRFQGRGRGRREQDNAKPGAGRGGRASGPRGRH